MGLAGITASMGNTGDREEIGPITDFQADYVLNGSSLPSVLAQAEAAGTFPWNVRDPNTGAPLNIVQTYPKATTCPGTKSAPGGPPIILLSAGTGITFDAGHTPACSYVPFLLTGDPYHLEHLQFQANMQMLSLLATARPYLGTDRYAAWPDRDLMFAVAVTPATVPSWLLPQSYWVTYLNSVLGLIDAQLTCGTGLRQTVFSYSNGGGSQASSTQPTGTYIDFWQQDYYGIVVGWMNTMAQAGLLPGVNATKIAAHAQWLFRSIVARTNGTSGYVRACQSLEQFSVQTVYTGPVEPTWAAAWALTAANLTGSTATPYMISTVTYVNPNIVDLGTMAGTEQTYFFIAYAALASAVSAGAPGAAACYTWMQTQIAAQAATFPVDQKWRIA